MSVQSTCGELGRELDARQRRAAEPGKVLNVGRN
jgi:hypothetical protein